MAPLVDLLFPDPVRDLPGQRILKIFLRAAHVLCAGTLTGGHLVGGDPDLLRHWLWATIATGALILMLDLYQSCAFLLQVRGAVLLVKFAGLAAALALPESTGTLLAVLVLLSVVSSHAPSRWRYRLLVGAGRIKGAESKG